MALLSVMLWSCKKDETRSVITTSGASSSLKTSANTVVVDKSMLTSTVITFTFSQPDYGYKAGVANVIQLSTKADNFAAGKFREYAVEPNASTKSYNGADFNTMLLALNLSTSANTDIVARLKSTVSDAIDPIYSNVVSISAKPFPLTAWVYVPGAYQGWDPTSADSLVSATGNGVYTGVITFTAADQEFKITPKKNWDNDYGDAGGGKLVAKGGNLKVSSAGPKLVTVNLNDMTYSIEDNKIWSLIGDATAGGWGGDTDMKTINDGKNVWKVTTDLGVGELKFRFAHDWGTNLGGNLSALNPGGDNIKIAAAGNYTITLTVAFDSAGKVTGGAASIVKN
ncbi:Outer membrane protein [compost metagenome]